jgi:hypothetical protein
MIVAAASSLLAVLVLGAASPAQPPDRPRPFGRAPGFGGIEQRVLDDFRLPEPKREAAGAAVREYQDNLRRLTEMAGADLLAKLKTVLSADDYKKLKEATDRFRAPPRGDDRRLRVDDVVERLLAFDTNKDGKVTRDELPERMQDLIARGDINKDGALDRDEIRKLAEELAREGTGRGAGPGGRPFPGRGAPSGLSAGTVERALRDLKVAEKKEAVDSAIQASQENVRKLTELARADLLLKLADVLDEAQLTKFQTALERPGGRDGRPRPPRPPDGPERE